MGKGIMEKARKKRWKQFTEGIVDTKISLP